MHLRFPVEEGTASLHDIRSERRHAFLQLLLCLGNAISWPALTLCEDQKRPAQPSQQRLTQHRLSGSQIQAGKAASSTVAVMIPTGL